MHYKLDLIFIIINIVNCIILVHLSTNVCYLMHVLQLNAKKRLVYIALALVWTIVPSFLTTMGALVVSDIIKGTCVPWGAYRSYVAEKILTSVLVSFTYLLPMTLTVFCYLKIVYTLLSRKVGLTIQQSVSVTNIYGCFSTLISK